MSLEQLGIEALEEELEAFSLAAAIVAMGLEGALHEEPNNPVLVPLARDLIASYVLKTFGFPDHVADLMADELMESIRKELDL